MTPGMLLDFMRSHNLAVQTSVSPAQTPQGAVVGFAVSDELEIVFDTLDSTRKAKNLLENPRIGFVIGGLTPGDERTVQYEGIADRPQGAELERLIELYLSVFPDGRERLQWTGLVYLRARPVWIRYSDYNQDPPLIVEFTQAELRF
jgi:hypothetical protein